MILKLGDDGVFINVDEEELVYADKKELEQFIESYHQLEKENEQLKSENEKYKNIFIEIVETALDDANCRELYCKGVLNIFDKANSLNQAREMIKEYLK